MFAGETNDNPTGPEPEEDFLCHVSLLASSGAAEESVKLGIAFETGVIGPAVLDSLKARLPMVKRIGDLFEGESDDEYASLVLRLAIAAAGVMAARKLHAEGKGVPMAEFREKNQGAIQALFEQILQAQQAPRRPRPSRN